VGAVVRHVILALAELTRHVAAAPKLGAPGVVVKMALASVPVTVTVAIAITRVASVIKTGIVAVADVAVIAACIPGIKTVLEARLVPLVHLARVLLLKLWLLVAPATAVVALGE
jgi:hypothetical protein